MKDKQIEKLIKAEQKRQGSEINLIPSENLVSKDVLDALGSVFNNKYSEGYPGARYYGGNINVDKLEKLAQKRALDIFKLSERTWGVNVQPLSGAVANLAIYTALMGKSGKIMAMDLSHGGHLSHAHKVSITGKMFKQVAYRVDKETEQLDYKELKKLAQKTKPDVIVAGYTAYSRKINWKAFSEIADSCGAYLVADISHLAGLIAQGVYSSPFKYADVVMTTTHKTLRGPRAAIIFSKKDLSQRIDKAVFPGLQGGPHNNQIAAVAVALKEAQSANFKKYAKQVVINAKAMSEELKRLGWRIISQGTDSHLILIDTWMDGRGISGGEASKRLEKNGIIVNKNTIPFDKRKPMDPSGIRIGTPFETTKGKTKKDFVEIAKNIDKILKK